MRASRAIGCVLSLVVVTSACSAPSEPSSDASAAVSSVPFFAAADDSGAVVIDPRSETLTGIARGAQSPAWNNSIGFDRKYVVCEATCPASIASGRFDVVEGPAPEEFAVHISATGAQQLQTTDDGVLWAPDEAHRIVYVPGTDAVGAISLRDADGAPLNLSADDRPDWYPARDQKSGVLRLSPQSLLFLRRAKEGWRQAPLPVQGDVNFVCVDAGRVVTVTEDSVFVDGREMTTSGAGQIGSCDLWGNYLLTASYSNSSESGNSTIVELRTLSGSSLWQKTFTSLSRPYIAGASGEVAIATGGALKLIGSRGDVVLQQRGVVDVRITPGGDRVTLTKDGLVDWQ